MGRKKIVKKVYEEVVDTYSCDGKCGFESDFETDFIRVAILVVKSSTILSDIVQEDFFYCTSCIKNVRNYLKGNREKEK